MLLSLDEFVRYSNEERDKWRHWFVNQPEATGIEVQPGGRYPTVGMLIDHIFLVERRHLQRLQSVKPDEVHRVEWTACAAAVRLRRVGPSGVEQYARPISTPMWPMNLVPSPSRAASSC